MQVRCEKYKRIGERLIGTIPELNWIREFGVRIAYLSSDEEKKKIYLADNLYLRYKDPIETDSAYEFLERLKSQKEEAAKKEQESLIAQKEAEKKAAEEAKEAERAEKEAAKEEAAKKRKMKSAAGSVASTAAGTIGREVGKTLGGKVGGKYGKTLGGNIFAQLGRSIMGTFFK